MKLKEIFDIWKKVFTSPKYLTFTIIVALIFYSINVILINWSNLWESYQSIGFFQMIKFFFIVFIGFKNMIMFHSFISLIITSILFGMLFSLVAYKVYINQIFSKSKVGILGATGLFLAALAPGCASCGIGLAAFLGIGAGFLSFLPYEGFELSIASIALLGITVVYLTKNIYLCKIKDLNTERRLIK